MSKNVQFVKNEGVTCSSNLHSKFHKVYNSERTGNRRRMETEAKAKVVVSVWGAKFIQVRAASCFASVNLKEKVEFILFFQIG